MVSFGDVQRLNLGYVLKPAEATDTGQPQVVPIQSSETSGTVK